MDAELETVQAYLGIELTRFENRLNVSYDCESALSDALVPSLILQPLIENSMKYAVSQARDVVTITISASSAQSELILSVEDESNQYTVSQHKAGSGLGLKIVGERLRALHGAGAKIRTEQRERGFFTEIRLPLVFNTPIVERDDEGSTCG